MIFWSGSVADNGNGPVEPGAHFYRSYQLDGDGNPINKRNAWQARSVLYVRLIPPGAADVVHYRVHDPEGRARARSRFTAKLNYRKFSWYYTQFAYAGEPKPGQDPALVTAITTAWSISFDPPTFRPMFPARSRAASRICPSSPWPRRSATVPLGEPTWTPVVRKQDRERWNDWGIGLLLQGDLKGAEYAFKKVTEAEPGYADGWLNVARALIQEGETDAAKPYIEKALAINPKLGRIYFFKALIAEGRRRLRWRARSRCARRESQYPRDRVVLNQIGAHPVSEAPVCRGA